MRSCTDRTGMRWEVFEVHPGADGRTVERMPEVFRTGWLCFQSATERRRLAPIPRGWQDWDDHALLGALDHGHRSARRTPPEFRLPPYMSGSHERQPPRGR
ncbi:MAG TPA: hypothetical protein VFN38_02100 [Gemmatimonadaceae bacterium]|nr:hypothetical protein [Gemmatimonadaceae bacterium]